MKKYQFCPYCGSSSKKYKDYFGCPKCGKKVFVNSHPTASAFVVENGKYLISKRAIEPKKGSYDVVGGFLNNGEHPETGIVKEFKEETGLTIKIVDLLGVYMDKYEYQEGIINTLNLCYIVEIVKGIIKPQDDVASLHWFKISNIPNTLAFEWISKALKDLQKWHKENKSG